MTFHCTVGVFLIYVFSTDRGAIILMYR